MSRYRLIWITLLSFGLAAGALTVSNVYALNQSLPGGLDAEAGGRQNSIEMHLKYLPAAEVTDNLMGAYYPGNDSSANGKKIKITAGPEGQVCNIDDAALNGRVRITIAIEGNSAQYDIPISKVCGPGSDFYDKEFAFPNGSLIKDPGINRYRADITVNYKIQDDRMPASLKSDLNYKIEITGNNKDDGTLALMKTDGANQFGMRSSFSNNPAAAPNNTLRIAIPFGFSCNWNDYDQGQRQVKLYDADGVFGDTYMWVQKDGSAIANRLPEDAYGFKDKIQRWEGDNDRRWKVSHSDKSENILTIKTDYIERGAKYELVVTNPGTNVDNKDDPYSTFYVHWNTLSVRIPQDSIYIRDKCDYDLRPTISINQSSYVYYPDLQASSTVNNTGGGPINEGHAWEIYAVRFAGEPSTRDLRQDKNNEDPCGSNVMPTGATGCGLISSSTYSGSGTHSKQFTSGGPDAVGTRLCFFARVQNPTHWAGDDNLWHYSPKMECSISAKKPRAQFRGSDLRVSGNVTSGSYLVQGSSYGSWAEYGMFLSGVNSMAASGGALKNGSTASVDTWNQLTFANRDSIGNPSYGYYGLLPGASSAHGYFTGLPRSSDSLNAATIPNGVYNVGASVGNTLARLPEAKGGGVVLIRDGNFTISDNIIVDNAGRTNAREITQVVIVANNIMIDEDVTRVDAWLVTPSTGSITTCPVAFSNLNAGECNQKLTVNGAIHTGKLYLRRTAGANPPGVDQLKEPAEVFNLRPDAQLWAYTYANKADYAQTDYIQELPPRY